MSAKGNDGFTELMPDEQGMCDVPITRLEQLKPNREVLRFVARFARVRKADGKPFSFFCPDKQEVLKQTGHGALLLLDFVMYLGVVCLVLGAVAALMVRNYNHEAAITTAIFRGERLPPHNLTRSQSYTPHAAEMFLGEHDGKRSMSPYWQWTIGAYQYSSVSLGFSGFVALVTGLAMVGRVWIDQRLERNEKRLTRKVMTASDYSVSLSRFPRGAGKFTEKDVADFCGRFGTVRQVAIGYSTGKLGALAREVREIDWRVQELEIARNRSGDKKFVAGVLSLDALRTPTTVIKRLQKKREKLVKRIRKKVEGKKKVHKGSGTVLVTFDKPREASACIRGLTGFHRRLIIFLGLSACLSRGSKFLGQYVVMAERADEPDDVYWHNLQYGKKQRFMFSLFSGTKAWCLTFVAAAVQFAGFYIRQSAGGGVRGQVLSFAVSAAVAFAQGMVLQRIEAAASGEHHPTRSEEFASVARKQTRVTILLSGIVLLAAYAHDARHWPTSNGLLGAAFTQLVSNALQGPVKSLSQNVLKYYGKKRWVLDNARTQLALLEAADPPEMQVVSAFSDASGVFCVALFYTPIMPAGLPIAGAGMILRYIVLRYELLRLCKKPPLVQGVVCKAVSKAMLEAIRISAVASMVFFFVYSGRADRDVYRAGSAIGAIATVLSLFGHTTPIPRWCAACFNCRRPRKKGSYEKTSIENMDLPLAETIGTHKLYSCPPARELLQQAEQVSTKTFRLPHSLLEQTKAVEMSTTIAKDGHNTFNPLDAAEGDTEAKPGAEGV